MGPNGFLNPSINSINDFVDENFGGSFFLPRCFLKKKNISLENFGSFELD